MTEILLRGGHRTSDARLDRLPSATTEHLEKYPLTAATLPSEATPVVIGVNWYASMDEPIQRTINGKVWWVLDTGPRNDFVRGGHAVCLRPWTTGDTLGWWRYYDQGVEGRCVEFATLRALSLLNRRRYDIRSAWLYHEAQRNDEWTGGSYPGASPVYEGTSVRAGLEVVRSHGATRARWGGRPYPAGTDVLAKARPEEGIAAYRWARDWADVRTALRVPSTLPGVPLLNSWGEGYPREVLLTDRLGARLLAEDGEFGVLTDR